MENQALVHLHESVRSGKFPAELISTLEFDQEALSECEFLDFKRSLPENDLEYAKAARAMLLHYSIHLGGLLYLVLKR